MEESKGRICKHCEFLEHEGFTFCLMQDLYTEVGPYDEACDSFIEKLDETIDEESEPHDECESDKI